MMNYERPMLIKTEQMSEGVYLASGANGGNDDGTGGGSGCYTANAYIHQKPETGRGNYKIQVNGQHAADHTKEAQTLTISFNLPVVHVGGGTLISGDGSSTLVIALSYHQNPNDNIGFGDLTVTADEGLAITGVTITD